MLPVIKYKGKKYYLDVKLKQIREIDNPHNYIDFNKREEIIRDEK
tara:strand:- start:113 stop:247 length:135 start_codon:yes stop_codon:yes gene_type:complete